MLLNLTNHPIEKWDSLQKEIATRQFGSILDYCDSNNLSFPNIPPEWDGIQVALKAQQIFTDILAKYPEETKSSGLSILLSGEMSFVIYFNTICQNNNIPVYVATSLRNTRENPDGSKTVYYKFNQFRKI